MGIGEWLQFLQDVGAFEMGLLTVPAAQQAFLWSRIRSCTSYSDVQEMRMRDLFFEDFMEAIVRLASILALPTVEEIENAGVEDGGVFLLALYRDEREGFDSFVAQRTQTWLGYPRQFIHRCVDHLMALFGRLVRCVLPDNSAKA